MTGATDWLTLGACSGGAAGVSFAAPSDDPDEESRAAAICCGCPVQVECLVWAMRCEAAMSPGAVPHRFDIYGGLRPSQRDDLAVVIADVRPTDIDGFVAAWLDAAVAAS